MKPLSFAAACCGVSITIATTASTIDPPEMRAIIAAEQTTPLAPLLPFAYYPSTSELDVAFDRNGDLVREAFRTPPTPSTVDDSRPGLAYAYFEDSRWDWNTSLPRFDRYEPDSTGTINNVLPQDLTRLPTGWGAVYTGYIVAPRDGLYTFYVRPYAKGRLHINGREVVETVKYGSLNWRGGAIMLSAGHHHFHFEQLGWSEWLQTELPPETLRIAGPGLPYQPLPDRMLRHSPGNAHETIAVPPPSRDEASVSAVADGLTSVEVRVADAYKGAVLARGILELDDNGRGQGRMNLPNLPDGEYAVSFVVDDREIRALSHFRRIHFPWEGNTLGIESRIYPPFERVRVNGEEVSVSDRTYTINAFGAVDQVIAMDRPLLARPIRVVCVADDGEQPFTVLQPPRGHAPRVDQAIFTAKVASEAVEITTVSTIEEDGCIRVEMTLSPGQSPHTIQRMWLEIVLDDEQVPLFHYVANNNLRHNYAGATPRGGRIRWLIPDRSGIHAWPAVPPTWEAEPGPEDGVIWHALQTNANNYTVDGNWREQYRGMFFDRHDPRMKIDNFVPYIWLGSVERGLAWFADTDRHFRAEPDQPVQTLTREGGHVVLRVYLIQKPTTIDESFTMTYGLMASPTKPMRRDWRTDPVPGGAGLPVVCWGGYWCADKYPDNRDFSIVDLRQEARRRDQQNKQPWTEDMEEQLAFRAANRAWIDSDVLGQPWEHTIRHWFSQNAVYFEEHIIRQRSEEWQVFQDEWAVRSFNRFLEEDAHWYVGATARSYRDFAVYYANEWMKRGVSLYFDNTFPKIDRNHYANGFEGRSFTYWSHRDYYLRIYKLMSSYNEKGSEWPLHFTLHMTNTQTLPFNSWATATLDLEQGYRVSPDGEEVPFPPEYTLAVTLGRQVGVTPHVMYPLRNIGRFTVADRAMTPRQEISDWGMHAVHELAHAWFWKEGWFDPSSLVHDYRKLFLDDFEYAGAETRVHNYWADEPFLVADHPAVRWIVVERDSEPSGLLLLQSYSPDEVETTITLPRFVFLYDVERGERLETAEDGRVIVALPDDYGTRMFVFTASQDHLPRSRLVPRSGDRQDAP
jgi:hypothetical protein